MTTTTTTGGMFSGEPAFNSPFLQYAANLIPMGPLFSNTLHRDNLNVIQPCSSSVPPPVNLMMMMIVHVSLVAPPPPLASKCLSHDRAPPLSVFQALRARAEDDDEIDCSASKFNGWGKRKESVR